MKQETSHTPALDVLEPRNLELGPFAAGEQDAGPWAHWHLRTDEDRIAWLLLAKIETDKPRGLVIRSGKQNGFVAGADIGQFRGVTDTATIEALLTRGHAVFDRLDRLPLPTVAVVHGFCLGGGRELALA